jgi:hypothetical protein
MGRAHLGHQGFAGFVVQFLQAGGLHVEGAIRSSGLDMTWTLRRHQENDLAHSVLLSFKLGMVPASPAWTRVGGLLGYGHP